METLSHILSRACSEPEKWTSAQRATGNKLLLPFYVSCGLILLSTTTWIPIAEKKIQGNHQLQGEFGKAKLKFRC